MREWPDLTAGAAVPALTRTIELADLRGLRFRFASLVFAGETVRCEGEVTAVTEGAITLALRVVVAGDPERVAVTPASAVVGRYR
ncbi:MAG TPA: hypothetical protein VNF47_28820 [Streptosporangiaceae bacterium]|nr:hypothetical protein [Streptosporangiaceae bacterium]